MTTLKVIGWSPTALERYEQCPLLFKHRNLLKTCPICFKGKVMGGYDTPAVCDTCGGEIETPEAMARGTRLGKSLEEYINGESKKLDKEIRHPTILEMAKRYKAGYAKGRVKVELPIVLDAGWKPVSVFTKGAWFRGKLDVYEQIDAKNVEVTDWKSGGIDKRTGEIRSGGKYDDQISIYNLMALVAFPTVERAEGRLAFLDCGPRFDPIVKLKHTALVRGMLERAKTHWLGRIKPMFADRRFDPKPNDKCKWCEFAKGKGGPCRY